VFRGEGVFRARNLDLDRANDGTRVRRRDAGFLQDFERFRLHRHR